jgi:hypothetical protein
VVGCGVGGRLSNTSSSIDGPTIGEPSRWTAIGKFDANGPTALRSQPV